MFAQFLQIRDTQQDKAQACRERSLRSKLTGLANLMCSLSRLRLLRPLCSNCRTDRASNVAVSRFSHWESNQANTDPAVFGHEPTFVSSSSLWTYSFVLPMMLQPQDTVRHLVNLVAQILPLLNECPFERSLEGTVTHVLFHSQFDVSYPSTELSLLSQALFSLKTFRSANSFLLLFH